MKKIRAISLTMAIILVMLCFSKEEIIIGAEENSKAAQMGFIVDKNNYTVTWCKKKIVPVYGGSKKKPNEIGALTVNVGRARYNEKIDGKYMDTILISVKMTPKRGFTLWRKNKKMYGFCEYLKMTCNLNKKLEMIAYTPASVPSGTSYSISAGVSIDDKGASGQIGGSISYVKDAFFAHSAADSTENRYGIVFDYEPTFDPFQDKINKYLLNENTQISTISIQTTKINYSIKLNCKAGFGESDGKKGNGFTQFIIGKVNYGSKILKFGF